jgi:hypothetical protein
VSTDSLECNFPCAGDSSETCGAGNRLNVYKKTASSIYFSTHGTRGCYTDDLTTGVRALDSKTTKSSDMTVEKCASIYGTEQFSLFGLEYYDEVILTSVNLIFS